jgi:hypothetical protein
MSINPPRSISDIMAAESAQVPEPTAEASQLPYHIALIIDGVVQQVFHVEERLAAVFLSSPTIVQCDSPANGGPDRSWTYDANTGAFIHP